jgi:osmotically-inducible protein OsmY
MCVRAAVICGIACAMLLLASALSGCAALGQSAGSDARITAAVTARLAAYPELQEPNVLDVQTLHGVVYLHGLMSTPFEIGLAASVAGDVSGVRRVENLLGLENAR